MSNPDETVTILRSLFESLCKDSSDLAKLHAGGVDNWEWYSESLDAVDEEEDDED